MRVGVRGQGVGACNTRGQAACAFGEAVMRSYAVSGSVMRTALARCHVGLHNCAHPPQQQAVQPCLSSGGRMGCCML